MKESTLTKQAVAAMESAVRKVVEDHKRLKRPLAVWQDGKVVMQNPEQALAARALTDKPLELDIDAGNSADWIKIVHQRRKSAKQAKRPKKMEATNGKV